MHLQLDRGQQINRFYANLWRFVLVLVRTL